MTAEKVREKLKRLTSGCITQRELARRMGCSPTFLNEVIRGIREPSGPVLKWLGMRRKVVYVADPAKAKA
jgi:transcriptional regulator with XRE-family HTH domain